MFLNQRKTAPWRAASRKLFSAMLAIGFIFLSLWRARAQSSSVTLVPGDDIQSAVDANPGGTTFTLADGTYRLQSIVPKDGDTFTSDGGAILDGAILIPSSS